MGWKEIRKIGRFESLKLKELGILGRWRECYLSFLSFSGFLVFWLSLFLPSSLAGTIRDDFNDGSFDGWKVTTPGRGSWKVENGELVGDGGNPSHDIVIGESKWKDYSMECRLKLRGIARNENEGYLGAALRYQDTDNGHWFMISNTGLIIAGVAIDGGLLPKKIVGFPLEINVWFKFKAEVKGDNFKVHINDNLLLDYNEKGYASGKIALFVLNTKAHFDDVIIRGDEVLDKVPQLMAPKGKIAVSWGRIKVSF